MSSHMWEKWDAETKRRMAEELLFHGAARAGLVVSGLKEGEN